MKCHYCVCSEAHDEYWECPLLGNKTICDVCCNYDVISVDPKTRKLEIIKVIKKITGKDMTNEQVIETCLECGKGKNFRMFLNK